MDRPPDWKDWLLRGALVAASLGCGVYLASRVSPTRGSAPMRKAAPLPTEAQLAEADRLVTVAPPKTRETFLVRVKSGRLGPCVVISGGDEAGVTAVLDWLERRQVRANLFVDASTALAVPRLLRRAAQAGHSVGSLGYRRLDAPTWAGLGREEQDRSFKAANRAVWTATGARPRFFLWEGKDLVQEVVDTAAINGMLTVRGPSFHVVEGTTEALERWSAASNPDVQPLQTLDEAYPLPSARGLGPHAGETAPER